MKKPPAPPRLATPGHFEKTLSREGRDLLVIRADWPRLEPDTPGLKRIDRYYDVLFDRWRRRWEGPLLDRAAAELPQGAPPWEARLTFTVTLLEGGFFSVYLDAEERTGERRPRRVRQGDVWRVPEGLPVTLRELLPPQKRWWKAPVIAEVRRQVGGLVQSGECLFHPDWLRLTSRKFSPARSYLTPQGPAVFYPVGAIAPALEGFPVFPLTALLAAGKEK